MRGGRDAVSWLFAFYGLVFLSTSRRAICRMCAAARGPPLKRERHNGRFAARRNFVGAVNIASDGSGIVVELDLISSERCIAYPGYIAQSPNPRKKWHGTRRMR